VKERVSLVKESFSLVWGRFSFQVGRFSSGLRPIQQFDASFTITIKKESTSYFSKERAPTRTQYQKRYF